MTTYGGLTTTDGRSNALHDLDLYERVVDYCCDFVYGFRVASEADIEAYRALFVHLTEDTCRSCNRLCINMAKNPVEIQDVVSSLLNLIPHHKCFN